MDSWMVTYIKDGRYNYREHMSENASNTFKENAECDDSITMVRQWKEVKEEEQSG